MGNLPVIIMPAICAEKNNPFGDSVTCSRNGMSYVSLSMSVIRNYFSALSKMLCYEHCWGTVCYCLWLGISISLLIVLFLFEPHISIFYFVQIGAIFVWCYVYNIVPAYRDENDTIIQINSTLVQKLYGGASTESLREELLSKDFPNSQDCEAPSNMLLKRPEERIEVVPLFFFCWKH